MKSTRYLSPGVIGSTGTGAWDEERKLGAEMSSPEKQAIEAIQKELVLLTAENLAMQFVLTCLMQRIGQGNPRCGP
jgi:hypothetical protein